MISKSEAESLFVHLTNGLDDLRQAIEEIVTKKAWTPLGYSSLGEALGDRLKVLNAQSRSALVASLVAADVPGTEIVKIEGVTPVSVVAAMQLAGKAPTPAGSPGSSQNKDATRIQVTVSNSARAAYVKAARKHGLSLGDFILEALDEKIVRATSNG